MPRDALGSFGAASRRMRNRVFTTAQPPQRLNAPRGQCGEKAREALPAALPGRRPRRQRVSPSTTGDMQNS